MVNGRPMTHNGSHDSPPEILVSIDWLVRKANGYRGRLQSLEVHSFKSDLVERSGRWTRDRVPPAAFTAACTEAGLAPDNTAKLVEHLRNRQTGKRLVVHRFRRKWTFDRLIAAAGLADIPS